MGSAIGWIAWGSLLFNPIRIMAIYCTNKVKERMPNNRPRIDLSFYRAESCAKKRKKKKKSSEDKLLETLGTREKNSMVMVHWQERRREERKKEKIQMSIQLTQYYAIIRVKKKVRN